MPGRQDITILGAGIAGLALARALALQGRRVTVLEQAEAVRELGAGLQITPNGAKVIEALGLGDAMRAVSMRNSAVELRDGLDGREVARLDMARLRPDQTWHLIHRVALVGILHQGARDAGVELRLLQKANRVELTDTGPVLTTAQGAAIRPGLLIGADGVHSVTRRALNGAGRSQFSGQVAWRATIPVEEGASTVAEVHMGPGRHVVSYPMAGGLLRNIVAVEERSQWTEENWSLPDDPAEMRLAFDSFGPRVRGWLDQVEECWLWGLFRHPVAQRWGWSAPAAPDRGVAILGDAAHPTLPFLAQGANMALEDAWVLAERLNSAPDLATALELYQRQRIDRTRRIVAAAAANARNYHLTWPLREIAHAGLSLVSRHAPGRLVGRYDWIHGHDVTAVR